MDPLIGSSLITAGGGILGGLGKMLFGGGDRERIKQFAQYLKGQLINPQDFANQMGSADFMATAPRRNAMAENTNQRLGLDSGVAQTEMNNAAASTDAASRIKYVGMGIDQNQQVRQMLSNLYSSLLR